MDLCRGCIAAAHAGCSGVPPLSIACVALPTPAPHPQVMEEGEVLSKKQLALEQTVKKLRWQVRAAAAAAAAARHELLQCNRGSWCISGAATRRAIAWQEQPLFWSCFWTLHHHADCLPDFCPPPSSRPRFASPPHAAAAAQVRELQAETKDLAASLEGERAKAASAVSERAATAGELYSIREQHAAELAAERQHYERLLEVGGGSSRGCTPCVGGPRQIWCVLACCSPALVGWAWVRSAWLQRATAEEVLLQPPNRSLQTSFRILQEEREARAAAEGKAAEAARVGVTRRLKEAEARVESLEGMLAELRAELERQVGSQAGTAGVWRGSVGRELDATGAHAAAPPDQPALPAHVSSALLAGAPAPLQRAAADEREELLSGEVTDLQRRCAEAEARQQEAAARIPEATSALMRQLESMQVGGGHCRVQGRAGLSALQVGPGAVRRAGGKLDTRPRTHDAGPPLLRRMLWFTWLACPGKTEHRPTRLCPTPASAGSSQRAGSGLDGGGAQPARPAARGRGHRGQLRGAGGAPGEGAGGGAAAAGGSHGAGGWARGRAWAAGAGLRLRRAHMGPAGGMLLRTASRWLCHFVVADAVLFPCSPPPAASSCQRCVPR